MSGDAPSGSAVRDLMVALVLVGGILGGVWLWSGVWPPMVVIESGSMMHIEGRPPYDRTDDVAYGRIGTIDPGDMVFVKTLDIYANDGRGDVELWEDPDSSIHFGMTGDVIVFYARGDRVTTTGDPTTPIIHRAVAYVDVHNEGDPGNRTYTVSFKGQQMQFNSSGVILPDIGLTVPFQWEHDGYLTKGDNRVTNRQADQAGGLAPQPIKPEWILGKARGEVPWFGLIKLSLGSDLKNPPTSTDPAPGYWIRVGNTYAPSDTWTMLASSLLAIVLVPLAWDVVRAVRERKRDMEAFEPVVMPGGPRPRVRPLPPPVAPGGAGQRIVRFRVVQREQE